MSCRRSILRSSSPARCSVSRTSIGADPEEVEIRALVDEIYRACRLAVGAAEGARPSASAGPRRKASCSYDWRGYNEAMLDLPARPRLAHASRWAPTPGRSGRARTTSTGARSSARSSSASRRCSAISTPTSGPISATSMTPTCGGAASTTSRTAGAPSTRSARTPSTNPAQCRDYGADDLGHHGQRRPGRRELEEADGRRRVPQLRGARRRRAERHDDCTLAPTAVVGVDSVRAGAGDSGHRWTCTGASASTSTPKYGFLDAFNRTFTFDVPAPARPLRSGLRLGGRATTSASTRGPSSR